MLDYTDRPIITTTTTTTTTTASKTTTSAAETTALSSDNTEPISQPGYHRYLHHLCVICIDVAVMLVLGLGLGLRGLALAKNSRPKSWRTTMFTLNFHRLE